MAAQLAAGADLLERVDTIPQISYMLLIAVCSLRCGSEEPLHKSLERMSRR
jgi:hypothetical protein